MDFKKQLQSEFEQRYVDMFNEKSRPPFEKESVNSYQTFENKRENYLQRLEDERETIEQAKRTIVQKINARLCTEESQLEKKARRNLRRSKFVRAFLLWTPVVFLGIVAFDIFDETRGHIPKIEQFVPLNVAIVLFSIFGALSLFLTIWGMVRMMVKEKYHNRHNIEKKKRYTVAAIMAVIFSFSILSIQVYCNLTQNQISFIGGDKDTVQHIWKGDYVSLPSCVKSDSVFDTYTIKYSFDGWLINDVFYAPEEPYQPQTDTTAIAVFSEVIWYKLVFTGGDSVFTEYVKQGTEIKLPQGYKNSVVHENYTTKYVFKGWTIEDTYYILGESYLPQKGVTAEASFNEVNWGTITVTMYSATVKLTYDGQTVTPKSDSQIEIPLGTEVTVSASYTLSDETLTVNGSSVSNPYTFILQKNTTIDASSRDTGCLVSGTMITMYDGSRKPIEQLQMGDVLLVFNHESGQYEQAPLLVNVHAMKDAEVYLIVNLYFSNGELLRIVDEHGLFDKDLNRYVYIDKNNAKEYIGHQFVSSTYLNGEIVSEAVTLDRVEITNEYTKIFNPASVWHINLIANNMLTLSAGMVNLFEYDENMKYDELLMAEDIEKYGLYTYEDFKDYVSVEIFDAFPFKYYKVAIGKGMYTYEQVLELIQFYNDLESVK